MRTLDQIKLKSADREAIESAAKVLRETLPVDRVVLFGSKARGETSPESDIDLLVLTHCPADSSLRRQALDILYPLELKQDKWFGLMLVSCGDWNEGIYQAMPIRREIDREGVEV